MNYTVIDKDGNDISEQVRVIQNTTDSYTYCRMMADKMLKNADDFYEQEIQSRFTLILNTKMEDFGSNLDINRGRLWSERIDQLHAEIEQKQKELKEMMDIAGDWEDKEYAARWKRVVDFLAAREPNPLLSKFYRNEAMKIYLTEEGAPNMAKYI